MKEKVTATGADIFLFPVVFEIFGILPAKSKLRPQWLCTFPVMLEPCGFLPATAALIFRKSPFFLCFFVNNGRGGRQVQKKPVFRQITAVVAAKTKTFCFSGNESADGCEKSNSACFRRIRGGSPLVFREKRSGSVRCKPIF